VIVQLQNPAVDLGKQSKVAIQMASKSPSNKA
jgi:hypothetical protein